MVLASAAEIEKMPKNNFRMLSKVVLGCNCSGPTIGVRDYINHPDYGRHSYNALTMVQLETDDLTIELRPICQPPSHFMNPRIYAMALSNDCTKPIVNVYKMKYVGDEECGQYYRRAELDMGSLWPKYATCAQAIMGRECVWRSGTALVTKTNGRWRLIGFGIYGPGCGAPARFLDYGMYERWVSRSVARIGRPAISQMDTDYIILRRTFSNVQRYGPCDPEETKTEIFTDTTQIMREGHNFNVRYNLSLYASVEYSCIVFRAKNVRQIQDGGPYVNSFRKPKISLRRWCSGPAALCHDFQYIEIHFYVEINFESDILFKVSAYGKEAKVIDPLKATLFANQRYSQPHIQNYRRLKHELKVKKLGRNNFWFYKEDLK
ncbi:uncharacterized protein LOC105842606 [Bombyx mori]|uniref:uncharacterized protein LOC105842606 n=1 Tax=Bombyx mori TaxID=7091 RepID=UPI002ED26D1D